MRKLTLTIMLILSFNIFSLGQSVKKTVITGKVGYKKFNSTSYCLKGKTATGRRAGSGIVAVDPKVIKLGSKLEIFGLGIFTASDTGGAIKGNKIDIWMPCSQTKKWGNRSIFIRLL